MSIEQFEPIRVAITVDHLATRADRLLRHNPTWDDPLLPAFHKLQRALRDVPVTIFLEGVHGLLNPSILRDISKAWEIGLHGWAHEPWSNLSHVEAYARLAAGLSAFQAAGCNPVGFRPPGGSISRAAESAVAKLGVSYISGTPTAQRGRGKSPIPNVPFRWPDVDFFQYADREKPRSARDLLHLWTARTTAAVRQQRPIVFVVHAAISGADENRLATLQSFVEWIRSTPSLSLTTASELAQAQVRQGYQEDALSSPD